METPWVVIVYGTNIFNTLEIMHDAWRACVVFLSTYIDFKTFLTAFWHGSTNSQYADKCTM